MRSIVGRVLVITFVVTTVQFASSQRPTATPSEAQAIIDRALERAEWVEAQDYPARYRTSMTRHVQHFHGDGRLRHKETRVFEVSPLGGFPYARLVSRDGQPLTEPELEREQERERAFLEALDEGRDPNEDDEDEITFNAELVSRYDFRLEGTELFGGRSTYLLSFVPRRGPLPVRRRIDRVLNKTRGRIWIDEDAFEMARVEFELIGKVRLWWGILGSMSAARGSLDRYPLEEGIWAPLRLKTSTNTRVLFRSTRRAETSEWHDYERVSEQ